MMKKLFSHLMIVMGALVFNLSSCSDHPVNPLVCPQVETMELIVLMGFATQFEIKFDTTNRVVEEYGILISKNKLEVPDINDNDAVYKGLPHTGPRGYFVKVDDLFDIPHINHSFNYRSYVRFKGIAEPCYGNKMYFYLRV